jgi:hypothetical protein
MELGQDICDFNNTLGKSDQEISIELCGLILNVLPDAEGRVWHGSPVWFLDGNPIVGYSLKKSGLELLFWSGRSFSDSTLKPIGKFQAAAMSISSPNGLDNVRISNFLLKAKLIQWNYKNLPKTRSLLKLGDW